MKKETKKSFHKKKGTEGEGYTRPKLTHHHLMACHE